ncbi:restriction endonuclease subunit S [Streptomyces albus]
MGRTEFAGRVESRAGVSGVVEGEGKLPEGWVRTTLAEVGDIVSGATPKTSVQEYWDGDIPWLTPDDLSKNPAKTTTKGRRSLTRAGYESCSTRLLPRGSVLFTSRAPIGYVTIAEQEICTNQGFKSITPEAGISPEYLYWYLQYKTPDITRRASGTTFKEISGGSSVRRWLRSLPHRNSTASSKPSKATCHGWMPHATRLRTQLSA